MGEFANGGREYQPKGSPVKVNVHDFPDPALGKAIPYGIYDITANTAWVSVGADHDTSAFAVETLRRWWNNVGGGRYPDADRLLICTGGSNGSWTLVRDSRSQRSDPNRPYQAGQAATVRLRRRGAPRRPFPPSRSTSAAWIRSVIEMSRHALDDPPPIPIALRRWLHRNHGRPAMVGIGHNGGDRLNSRLLPLMLAVGTLVTLGGAGFVSAGGPGLVVGSAIASAGSGSCAVPQTPAAAASAPKWVGTPAANRAKNALDQKIEHRFGDYTMIGQREMLSRGLIGMTRDLAQRVVVLVDPAGMVNEAAFEAELQQTSHTHHQHHPNDPMIEARVQEACHSSAELIRASAVITGRGWHPRAADAAYSSFLEPADATFHVTFQDSDRDVGEALEKKLGPLVTVDYTPGPPVQLDSCPLPKNRGHDCEQHWGGARIDIDGDGRGAICSVGFTVNTQNDGQAMTTAGHCFTGDPGWFESVVGDDIVTDTHEHSFGSVQRNLCPDVDVALINASNQGYNDNVYHNEYSPADDPLDVSDGQNSAVGDYICVGAGFSRSYCELEVTDLYGTLCLAICYDTSLMVTRSLDNFDHTQGGDSGSPMYTWLGNHAEINGMYLGQDTAFNGVTYSHRISTIESYLNVETATTNNWQAPS